MTRPVRTPAYPGFRWLALVVAAVCFLVALLESSGVIDGGTPLAWLAGGLLALTASQV